MPAKKPRPELDPSNPVVVAVAPLKADAIAKAEDFARDMIKQVRDDLTANDMDINKAAPYPMSTLHMSQRDWKRAHNKYTLYHRLTKSDSKRNTTYGRLNEPNFVIVDADRVAKFVQDAKDTAALQYLMFVWKLLRKVGDVATAELATRQSVWTHSYLTVSYADGRTDVWKTQQIINYSLHGLPFHQWPTRKVKGVGA